MEITDLIDDIDIESIYIFKDTYCFNLFEMDSEDDDKGFMLPRGIL